MEDLELPTLCWKNQDIAYRAGCHELNKGSKLKVVKLPWFSLGPIGLNESLDLQIETFPLDLTYN